MNRESHLVRQLLVAVTTDVFSIRFNMSTHMLIVRVLRHDHRAEPTAEQLDVRLVLILAEMSFVVFEILE